MTALTGARLSTMSRCPRMTAFTALGAPEEPMPLDAQEYLARGNLFELYVGRQLIAKHGKENVQRQVPVPWGNGYVGHADFVVGGDIVVEVVSTVAPSPLIFDFKSGQAKRYAHFLGLDAAVVHVVNPSRLTQADALPIRVTDADREQIDAEVAQVLQAVETRGQVLPERVCRKPGEARGRMCQFAGVCFEGWVAEPVATDDREEARRAALELYQAKRKERGSKEQIVEAEQERKAAQEVLSALLAPGETQVGPFRVKRVTVKGRTSIDPALLSSGLIDPALLAPYVKEGFGHDRFDIERTSEDSALVAADFGEDAPWTDEDLRGAA